MKQSTKIIVAVTVIAVVAIAAWYFLVKSKKKPPMKLGKQTILPDVPMQDDGSNQVKDVSNGLDPDVKAFNAPGAYVIPMVMPVTSTMPSSVPSSTSIHNNAADTGVLVPIGAPALNDNVLNTSAATA